jgi:hypothetical protein
MGGCERVELRVSSIKTRWRVLFDPFNMKAPHTATRDFCDFDNTVTRRLQIHGRGFDLCEIGSEKEVSPQERPVNIPRCARTHLREHQLKLATLNAARRLSKRRKVNGHQGRTEHEEELAPAEHFKNEG